MLEMFPKIGQFKLKLRNLNQKSMLKLIASKQKKTLKHSSNIGRYAMMPGILPQRNSV